MQAFNFNPEQGFLDTGVYTDPTSETEARTQLMSLHTQTKTFINNLVVEVNDMEDEILAIAGATGDPAAIAQIQSDLAAVKSWYFTDTISSPTSDSSVYTNGYKKTYNNGLITDATEVLLSFPNADYTGLVTWETKATGDIDLFFSANPSGINIRVTLIEAFATAI